MSLFLSDHLVGKQHQENEQMSASVAQLDARPTGNQEVAGSTPAEIGNILSWRSIMKYFLHYDDVRAGF